MVKPEFRDRGITEIMDALRDALKEVPGITYQVQGRSGPGGGGGGDIDIEIYLDNIEQTRQITNQIKRTILTEDPAHWQDVAEVKLSVEEQKPQIKVEFDREKMSELGLSTSSVGTLVTIFFRGVTASKYLDNGDEYDIIVRYDRSFRNDVHEVENMPIQTQSGEIVPLSTVAKIYEDLAPTQIDRKNQRRYQKVSLTLKNTYVDPKTGQTMKKDMNKTITKLQEMLDQMITEDEAKGVVWYYRVGGTAENFMLKCHERLCGAAQREICMQTLDTLEKYIRATGQPSKWMLDGVNKELKKFQYRAKCQFSDYQCGRPCPFGPANAFIRRI